MATPDRRVKYRKRPWEYIWTWTCDNCGVHGGMTTQIPQCPGCDHHRCSDCGLEAVKGYFDNTSSRPSSLLHKADRPSPPLTPHAQDSVSDNPRAGIVADHQSSMPHHSTPCIPTEEIFALNRGSYGEAERSHGTNLSTSTASPSSSQKSPHLSETFTSTECSMDSDTELGSVFGGTEEASSDEENTATISNPILLVFESRLLSILRSNPALAARLIPEIHRRVQLVLALETATTDSDTPSEGNGGTSESTSAQVNFDVGSSDPINNLTRSPLRKHGRESGQNNDQDGGNSKRSRSKPSDDPEQHLNFACHFHKRFPKKYNPHTNRKYFYCVCPLKTPELRRIKDHFGATHRPSQCDRCYALFNDIDELQTHRQADIACPKGSPNLREGIDDSQWQKIDKLLKLKRGRSPTDRSRHDIDKWFGIWDILFSGTDRPEHPWNMNPYDQQPSTIDADTIIELFEEELRLTIEGERISVDDRIHRHYVQALRTVLGHPASSHHSAFSPPSVMRDTSNDMDSPSSIETTGTMATRRSDHGRVMTLNDAFWRTRNAQGTYFPVEECSESQGSRDTPSVGMARHLNSATSAQFQPRSARSIMLDAYGDTAASSPEQDMSSISAILGNFSSASDDARTSTEHDQQSLDGFIDYNSYLDLDGMEYASHNAISNDANGGEQTSLGAEVNDESLIDRLDFENNSIGAMAPWYDENGGSKVEGTKYLNPSRIIQ